MLASLRIRRVIWEDGYRDASPRGAETAVAMAPQQPSPRLGPHSGQRQGSQLE